MTVSPACSCVGRCRSPCTPVLSDKPGVLIICNICCVFYFNFDITARHREMSDKRIYAAQLCFKCFSIFICYRYFVYYIFLSKVLKFQIYLRTSLGRECDRGICCSFAFCHRRRIRCTFCVLSAPIYSDLGIWRVFSILTGNDDRMLTIIYSDLAVRLFAFVKLADCSNFVGTSRCIFVDGHRSIICHMNGCRIAADPFYIS